MPEKICYAGQVLFVRQPDQIDFRWMLSRARLAGIEAVINVAGYSLRFLAFAGSRIIVRHVFFDIPSQARKAEIALKRIVIFAFDSLAVAAVTFGATLLEDVLAFNGSLCRLRKVQRQEKCVNEDEPRELQKRGQS